MKRRHIMTVAILTVVGMWVLPGCNTPFDGSNTDSDLLTRDQTVNMDDPYGGLNMADESPNFGDQMLAADYGPESALEYNDDMANDATVTDLATRVASRRYMMITWGNLEADSSITFVTDWSGSLCVDNGALVLERTIRFDAYDEILPRTSRDKLEWISHTRPHFDGILVRLHKYVKRDSTRDSTSVNVIDAAPKMVVRFKTGPLTVEINEEDLNDLHRVVKVDDAGNAVAFNTIVVEPQDCASGFLGGQWKHVEGRPGGIFRGKWISHNGAHMGYLRGYYGLNSRGEKVFFGKWINHGGRFQGLLRGHYDAFGDRPGGWFAGKWIGRNLRVNGELKGAWMTSDKIDGGGFFRGRWTMNCR